MQVSDSISYADLYDMAEHGPDVWVGGSAVYPWGRVYGGQVAAQGLWAAAQTVRTDVVPHSLHAYFIRGGNPDEPIRYEVDRIRDGRSFETRRVVARQSNGAILNLSASFHVPEEAPDVTAIEMPDVPCPEDGEADSWMSCFERRSVGDSSAARAWMRMTDPIGDDPLSAALAHTFLSDDMATEAVHIEHPLGRSDPDAPEWQYQGASLDHSIWFHRHAPATEWILHDYRSSGVNAARGLAFGELWTSGGIHVATIAQEVLVREAR